MLAIYGILALFLFSGVFSDYRQDVVNKILKMTKVDLSQFGLKYTNVNKTLQCIEPTSIDLMPYKAEDDPVTKIFDKAKSCLIANCATAQATAFVTNAYSTWSNCIKPSNITCFWNKIQPNVMKAIKTPYDNVMSTTVNCMKNNPGNYNKCANKAYAIVLGALSKSFVDQTCLKGAKLINAAEYKCAKSIAQLVIKDTTVLNSFECASSATPLSGTTPTCPS